MEQRGRSGMTIYDHICMVNRREYIQESQIYSLGPMPAEHRSMQTYLVSSEEYVSTLVQGWEPDEYGDYGVGALYRGGVPLVDVAACCAEDTIAYPTFEAVRLFYVAWLNASDVALALL